MVCESLIEKAGHVFHISVMSCKLLIPKLSKPEIGTCGYKDDYTQRKSNNPYFNIHKSHSYRNNYIENKRYVDITVRSSIHDKDHVSLDTKDSTARKR